MTMKQTILRSQNLNCPSCVAKIETALKALHGVEAATVHFATGRIEVRHDATQVGIPALVAAVRGAGYEAREAAF
jgi:copper chaperone CopZ